MMETNVQTTSVQQVAASTRQTQRPAMTVISAQKTIPATTPSVREHLTHVRPGNVIQTASAMGTADATRLRKPPEQPAATTATRAQMTNVTVPEHATTRQLRTANCAMTTTCVQPVIHALMESALTETTLYVLQRTSAIWLASATR